MSDEVKIEDLLQVEAAPEPATESIVETEGLQAAAAVVLPGARLKAEREARGLSLTEVAHALKFGARQIETLEADRYDQLQGATFLRGFIRSYARYLKLEDAPLLALLEAGAPPPQAEIVAPTNMGEAMVQPFIERNQKWLMLAMALVVVLAVGAYWLTMNEKMTRGSEAESETVKDDATAQAAPAQPVMAPTPVAVAAPAPEAPAAPVAPVAPPPVVTPVPQAAPAPVVPAPAAAATPVSAAAAQPAGQKQISLDFDGRSWVEIKDATQRIIFTGEYSAGNKQVVTGKPPFQLWIGKVSAVRVVYNEQKVNLQPYARDEVARLTLD
ncbi:MAG TPA: RodZ domain-containing protein [Rhodocyclaceae bacterium]|nr:RodZ domain-containing protein [Rhodocyclaceae bacterium]